MELPPGVPEPFAEIVRHSLEPKPADRWTIPQISKYLNPQQALAAARPAPRKRRFGMPLGVLVLLGLIVLIVAGVILRHSEIGTTPTTTVVVEPSATAPPASSPPETPRRRDAGTHEASHQGRKESGPEKARREKAQEEKEKREKAKAEKAVQEKKSTIPEPAPAAEAPQSSDQPLPDLTEQARSTIHGRVKVNVKVDVDASGAVTRAEVEPPGGGKYLSERALAAARKWKFQPVKVDGRDVPQQWRVYFEFQRTGTKVQPKRLSP